MKKNNPYPSNRSKQDKQEKRSSRMMKIFYILMLILLASSSLIRLAGARQRTSQAAQTSASESIPSLGIGTVARSFVFYRGRNGSRECDDLTITAAGNVVYSNCGKNAEKQYSLVNTEQAKIEGWIEQFQPINYEHRDETNPGNVTTQLYLNGQGNRPASDADIQEMIRFAEALIVKISAQP